MKNILLSILMLATIVMATGCREKAVPQNYVKFRGFALGTSYNIEVNLPDTTGLQNSLDSLLEEIESSMSVYRPNSLLNRLNRNETDSVDRHIAYCIEVASNISELSGGEYDITIRPITQAWGFNAEERDEHPNIDSLLQYVGYNKINVISGRLVKDNPNIQIDLNSIAKGYAVDLVGNLLAGKGAEDYIIEIGGEIVCRGSSSRGSEWIVGIDKPFDGNNTPGADPQVALALTDAGMATSGNYRKFFIDAKGQKVAHSINARTGLYSADPLLSATVVAPDCIHADAYATMLMVFGLERARDFLAGQNELSGYLIYTNDTGKYEAYVSPSLEKRIRK